MFLAASLPDTQGSSAFPNREERKVSHGLPYRSVSPGPGAIEACHHHNLCGLSCRACWDVHAESTDRDEEADTGMAGRGADQAAGQVLKEMAVIQVLRSKVGKRGGGVAQQVRARTSELDRTGFESWHRHLAIL